MGVEMKTRRNGLKFASRSFLILIAVTALFFSTQSLVAQEAALQQQGESGLSKHPWQYGVFVQGGFPPDYWISTYTDPNLYLNAKLQLFSAGFEAGKQTRRFEGPMPLRGRGEAMLEATPFWLARYPPQSIAQFEANEEPTPVTVPYQWNGDNFHGASVTPFLLRWNFSQRDSSRVVPWAQFGGGLVWTDHKFPLYFNQAKDQFENSTSVINFTPQVGAGVNIFNRPRHSANIAMKVIHISNASLGDHNPGLNFTFQFSAGYSWWK
jgi:hypothetical protein